jgi:hypothetical protein
MTLRYRNSAGPYWQDADQHEATPHEQLEKQIMDSTIPKNEREWWAAAEIERLNAEAAHLRKQVELLTQIVELEFAKRRDV